MVKKSGKADMSNMINRYNLFWVGLLCRITHSDVVMSSTWKFGWNENGTVKMDHKDRSMAETDKLLRRFGVNLISVTRKGKLQLNKNHGLDENALKAWCSRRSIPDITDPDEREQVLTYGRGTQIYDWLEGMIRPEGTDHAGQRAQHAAPQRPMPQGSHSMRPLSRRSAAKPCTESP